MGIKIARGWLVLIFLVVGMAFVHGQQVYFQSDFSNNQQKWFQQETDQYMFSVIDGKYRIASKNGGSWWAYRPMTWNVNGDYEISVTVKKVSGTDNYYFGLVLGLDAAKGYFHFLGITGQGDYVFANKGPSPKDLIPSKTNSVVAKGNSGNRLTLKKINNLFKFYINNEFVGEYAHQDFYGENFGFQIWSGNSTITIDYDDLIVKSVSAYEVPAVAQATHSIVEKVNYERYALVIGVKNYQYVQPLQNSLNDAQDMAAALKLKGFQVVELYDPKTKREIQEGVRRYFMMLNGKQNAAGLVFYSGHGMQVNGVNYLIPSTADPQIEADLDDQCVNMDYIMRAIEQAGNPLNVFILDACRNNPFRSFSRSSEKGLSMVSTPKGSYIVYATKPGSVASDGVGRNGLFTSKLLKYINAPDLNIEQVFKRVASEVAQDSNDNQRPWIASDFTGDFYFANP